jgi:hypothetical protein
VQKLRSAKTGVELEKPNSRVRGSIGFFEAYAISRLDFKHPEDYKDSCPIFCSRSQVFQDNFDGEVWCAKRWKRSDWIQHIEKSFALPLLCN